MTKGASEMFFKKSNESGRSMIEMLGVLAIVGILSIGAIAGYSKAMFKYKLQRTTDEYTIFFQNVLQYHKEFLALRRGQKAGEGKHAYIGQLLSDMGLLPNSSWIYKGNTIIDRLNNNIYPFIRKENNKLNFDISITADNTSIFVCEALYRDVLIQFSDNLYYINTWRQNSEDATSSKYTRYGSLYCNGTTRKCVKDLTLTDIRAICSICEQDDKTCSLIIDF